MRICTRTESTVGLRNKVVDSSASCSHLGTDGAWKAYNLAQTPVKKETKPASFGSDSKRVSLETLRKKK